MSFRETVSHTNWLSVILAAAFLCVWLTLGRWISGQPILPLQFGPLVNAGDAVALLGIIAYIGVCFAFTLLLAWIQITRGPTDLVSAGLLGVLVALIPVGALIADASRTEKLRDYAPQFGILLSGIVGASLVLYMVRTRPT